LVEDLYFVGFIGQGAQKSCTYHQNRQSEGRACKVS